MLGYTTFTHCPRCASERIVAHAEKAIRCLSCDFRYFHNAAAAVGGLIERDDTLLLVRRARDPRKGYWGLPGGFVDYRESLEEALLREIREETGLEVEVTSYLGSASNEYVYAGVTYFTADAYFICRVGDLTCLHPSEEIAEIARIRPADIDLDRLAFPSFKKALELYQARRNDR